MNAWKHASWHHQQSGAYQDKYHEAEGHHQSRIHLTAQQPDHPVREVDDGYQKQHRNVEHTVVENIHDAMAVVYSCKIHYDRYQSEHQQGIDTPSNETVFRLQIAFPHQQQMAAAVNQECDPHPEV